MRLILLGAPGAGKGTLAGIIKQEFKIAHVSTGDILREEMKNNTPLGQKVKSFIDSGQLVPDEVVTQIIEHRFVNDANMRQQGYMLDGFPRTLAQAQELDKILARVDKPVDYILNLEASLPMVLSRLSGRRICRGCGAPYHVKNRPPKKEGVCDKCGGELYQRADDKEETVKKRIEVYHSTAKPIVDYYRSQKRLVDLDGDAESEDLFDILKKKCDEDGKLDHP